MLTVAALVWVNLVAFYPLLLISTDGYAVAGEASGAVQDTTNAATYLLLGQVTITGILLATRRRTRRAGVGVVLGVALFVASFYLFIVFVMLTY